MIADLMEIELDRIRVEVVNRGDMRDILRINDVDIPGPTGITMTIELEARGATEERLAKLRRPLRQVRLCSTCCEARPRWRFPGRSRDRPYLPCRADDLGAQLTRTAQKTTSHRPGVR